MEWKAELQGMVEDSHSSASRLRFGEPLSKHTYFGIGGPATVYYEVGSIEDLIRFTAFTSQPFFSLFFALLLLFAHCLLKKRFFAYFSGGT